MLLEIIKITQELKLNNVSIVDGTKVSVNSLDIIVTEDGITFVKGGKVIGKCLPTADNSIDIIREHLEREKFPKTITIADRQITAMNDESLDMLLSNHIFEYISKEFECEIRTYLQSFITNKRELDVALEHTDLTLLVESALDPIMDNIRDNNTIDPRFNIKL